MDILMLKGLNGHLKLQQVIKLSFERELESIAIVRANDLESYHKPTHNPA